MSSELVKVYDLKEDHEYIRRVQEAILTTTDARDKLVNKLKIEKYGLFGSWEWWKAIENGTIPVDFIEGVITRVYMGGHNDFPEFEMDDGQEKTCWERKGKDEMYQVGRKIKIKYYLEKVSRQLLATLPYPYSKSVLEIWINPETSN